MRIARTRFVHLPRRVSTVEKAHGTSRDPQKTTVVEHATAPARNRAKPHAPQTPRVLWREVPNWHSLPGHPGNTLNTGARAYARASALHAIPVAGRVTNKVA